jgi:CheY-like chemotaxis protein/HPt (histidine-containing phosphotransfer) domain-containing protein
MRAPDLRGEFGKLMAEANRNAESGRTTGKAQREAEQTGGAPARFLAAMSHELRNPLNVIFGYTDLLLDQDLKPEQRCYLERIQLAGTALLTVVNDILDLATSERLVDLMEGKIGMDGKIGLDSKEGKRSAVWLSAPLPGADENAVVEQVATPAALAGTPGRILFVEDLEHNRDLARMILTNAGHEVDTAENGAAAITAVQTKTYDLVLMDVQMPVMDGVIATKRIRELDHPASTIPIIAMTANVLHKQVRSFEEAGMNDHIGKPFKKAELLQKVKTWLEWTRLRVRPPSAAPMQPDDANFNQLRELMGAEWAASGLARLRQQIQEVFGRDIAIPADRQQLASGAHALVSHSGLLGFNELSHLCSELEEAYTSGQDFASPYKNAKEAAHIADIRAAEMLGATASK